MDVKKLLIAGICIAAVAAGGIFAYDWYAAYSLASQQAQQEAQRVAAEEAKKEEEARAAAAAQRSAAIAQRNAEIDAALKPAYALVLQRQGIDAARIAKVEIVHVSPASGVLCTKTITSVAGRGNVFAFIFIKDGVTDLSFDPLEGKQRMEACKAAGDPISIGPVYSSNDDNVRFVQTSMIWL
ncbi:MAG TPA: hypothetical protein VH835_16240 [Dongiaceae bacterium]